MNPNIKYRAIRCSEEETQQLLNAWKRAEAVKNCTRHRKLQNIYPKTTRRMKFIRRSQK